MRGGGFMATRDQALPLGAVETVERDGGRLLINADYAEILERNKLDSAEALWNLQGEDVKKQLSTRGTERAFLSLGDGGEKIEAYVKRYYPLPVKEYVKNIISMRPFFPDGAKHEWDSILAFHSAGIATMEPIAVGSVEAGKGVLLTRGITGYRRASDLLVEWSPEERSAERLELVANIAELAGKMHAAEFAHQDFYLVHLFVLENLSVLPIDLQRIVFPDRFSRRWRVKDLGQLLYSAGKCATEEEISLFWRKYVESTGISEVDRKDVLGSAERKAAAILRRSERKKR